MPRPLKIKIFMDTSASAIEEQINAWLAGLGLATIIKTETAVSGTNAPTLVVTVWYELPTPDQERPGFRIA
jgi:hypothetical protein